MTEQATGESLLQRESRRKAYELIPFDVIVAIFMVTGLVGNIFVIYFYSKKTAVTPTTLLIVVLAGIDTFICVSMPKTIVVCEYVYRFTNVVLCKFYVSINYITSLFSCFTLTAIAIFRYRMVCKPHTLQYSIRDSYFAVLVMLIISLLLALPGPILYEIVEETITISANITLTSSECDTTKEPRLKPFVLFSHIVHSLVFLIGVGFLIVVYGITGRAMYNYIRRKSSLSGLNDKQERKKPRRMANKHPSPIEACESNERTNAITTTHISLESISIARGNRILHSTPVTNLAPSPTDAMSVFKTTIMLFVIHFVFIVSFLPYFAISFYSVLYSDFDPSPTLFTKICYNSYLLNSVTNPFIYGIFNMKFRHFVKQTFCSRGFCV